MLKGGIRMYDVLDEINEGFGRAERFRNLEIALRTGATVGTTLAVMSTYQEDPIAIGFTKTVGFGLIVSCLIAHPIVDHFLKKREWDSLEILKQHFPNEDYQKLATLLMKAQKNRSVLHAMELVLLGSGGSLFLPMAHLLKLFIAFGGLGIAGGKVYQELSSYHETTTILNQEAYNLRELFVQNSADQYPSEYQEIMGGVTQRSLYMDSAFGGVSPQTFEKVNSRWEK